MAQADCRKRQMQEINWNNFKAKFNGKEQKAFEWLCYLLFCNEFSIHKGIFRYHNQIGIETEPIEYDGTLVGFQAKFYETKLSEKKKDIKDSIAKAKSKNPKLNRILFYLNKEFSESSTKGKKEPAYKTEIEHFAKSHKIEIEWRVPSHFEAQLALRKDIAQHFFSLDKTVVDFIRELNQHTQSILAPIHSHITFRDSEITIDRSQAIKELKAIFAECPLVLVSGAGGVGKTVVIKEFYGLIRDTKPFFVFKATEFNIPRINHLIQLVLRFPLIAQSTDAY